MSSPNIMRETLLEMTAPSDAQLAQQLLAALHRNGEAVYYYTIAENEAKYTHWHRPGENGVVPKGFHTYHGVHGCRVMKEVFQRATKEGKDVTVINCLFVEHDAKDRQFLNPKEQLEYDRIESNHEDALRVWRAQCKDWSKAGKPGTKPTKPEKESLAFDLEAAKVRALAHIRALPVLPSVIVDSGGGYHSYWLLTDTFIIATDEDRDYITQLQARWVEVWGGDTGAKDLERVLRVPGTLNNKYDPPRPVTVIEANFATHALSELEAFAGRTMPTEPIVPPVKTSLAKPTNGTSGNDVIGTFNQAHKIADIIKEHGYTITNNGTRFIRAGKKTGGSGYLNPGNTLYSFSTGDELNTGHQVNAFDAWRILEHGGDMKAAVKEAAQQLNMTRSVKPVIEMDKLEPGDERALDDAEPAETKAKGRERASIRVNGREMHEVSAEAIDALAATGEIFIRGGELVRVCKDEKGRAGIDTVGESAMRGMLARCASFYNVTIRMMGKKDEQRPVADMTPIAPPLEIVRDVLSLKNWPFQALEGVIESPIMRPNGSILSEPGYDQETKLFYQPAEGFTLPNLPNNPDREDVAAALRLLHEVICDFPFEDDASRDNALAAMLTPIARPMISGPVPLATVDAPQQGTGKTLLAQCIGQLATGEIPEPSPAPDAAEEWRKTVTAQLSAGRAVIVLDNITKTLEDGSLAAVLTSTTWSDRLMGRNDKLIRLPARACWMVTGNNVRVGGDLVTRCYLIRLDAKTSRPQERDGFTHPQIETWVKNNRGVLLGAALTLCRAWHLAGCKPPTCPKSRYADWRNVIGGILEHAGAKDFLGNLRQFQDTADTEGPAWESFVCKLEEVFSGAVTSAMIYSRFAGNDELADYLPDELAGQLGAPDDQKAKNKFSQALGYAFRARVGKRFGDTQARVVADRKAQGSQYWRFMTSKEGLNG